MMFRGFWSTGRTGPAAGGERLAMPEVMRFVGESYFEDGLPIFLNIASEGERGRMPLHEHDFIEIAYVAKGQGLHLLGGTEIPVRKGDLCIINTSTPHLFIRSSPATEIIVYNCIFRPEFVDPALLGSTDFEAVSGSILFNSFAVGDGPVVSLRLDDAAQAAVEDVFHRMQAEYFNRPKGYQNILRACLIELLTRIFRATEAVGAEGGRPRHQMMDQALRFLKGHFSDENLTVSEVAMRTFLSRSYFSRLFRECTGMSFSDYLQGLRLNEACRLLATTDRKIADILGDIGLRDRKHFNEVFRRHTGMTPGQWRKEKRGGGAG